MGETDDDRFEFDSLYMLAVMKMSHDLGRKRSQRFDALLRDALAELGIDQGAFERYVLSRREELKQAAQAVTI